jgi:phosphoglycolate phosphatase
MKALIFDLDGTLVDSAEGILESLRHAFAACRLQPTRPPAVDCIGPPIRELLASLVGPKDSGRLDELAVSFKAHYDREGFRKARPYPGVPAALSTLSKDGIRLSIATNKRSLPTARLIASLGWDGLFDRVYSVDSFPAETHTKASLLKRLIADAGLQIMNCCYVGDRSEDAQAARAVGLRFLCATWGYGGELAASPESCGTALATPDMLLSVVAGGSA